MNARGQENEKPFHSHLEVVDGLRGLAILLVMWFHVWQLSWFNHAFTVMGYRIDLDFIPIAGKLGVELFFFISAFCLFYPYAQHRFEGKKRPSWRHYIYRRAIKILPSYYLAMAIMLVFAKHDFPPQQLGKQLITHLLFIYNWQIETKSTILGVFWSLAVEVQFYVVFPLIAWLFIRRPWLTYIGMLAFALGYRYNIITYHRYNFIHYMDQMPGFMDVFANGMLAAYLFVVLKNNELLRKKLTFFFTCSAVIMFAAMLVMFKWLYVIRYEQNGVEIWQYHNRLYLALIFCIILVSSCLAAKWWKMTIANRALVFLSGISYNLYIWHQQIARWLVKWHIPSYAMVDPHEDAHWKGWFTLVAFAAAIAFASFITYIFERPLLKKGLTRTLLDLWNVRLRSLPPQQAKENISN